MIQDRVTKPTARLLAEPNQVVHDRGRSEQAVDVGLPALGERASEIGDVDDLAALLEDRVDDRRGLGGGTGDPDDLHAVHRTRAGPESRHRVGGVRGRCRAWIRERDRDPNLTPLGTQS